MPKIFKVGGCVRDGLLGVKTKDIDFTFVLDDLNKTVEQGFQEMEQWMVDQGFTIFLSVPEMFTIRAKFPVDHKFAKLDADFVMARKEIGYVEGTRRPILELGTLEDDLLRRDFTVNAMAEDEDGNIIDLFDGKLDLERMVLITPKAPQITFDEDPLRIIRAIRFSITKGFSLKYLDYYISNYNYEDKMGVVSIERIREELLKCFKHDTLRTLEMLDYFPVLKQYVFKNNVLWLKPTFEQ
jgi:poly(A) polymerase